MRKSSRQLSSSASLAACLSRPLQRRSIPWGMTPIGVAWGYHEPEELLRAGAVVVAQSPAQLTEILLDR